MTDTPASKFSSAFKQMADRVDRTPEAEFAGAIVVVPPDGEPITVLMNDPKRDPAAFWSMAMSKVEIAVREVQQADQARHPMTRR